MVRSLLKAKADANITDDFGCSPVYCEFSSCSFLLLFQDLVVRQAKHSRKNHSKRTACVGDTPRSCLLLVHLPGVCFALSPVYPATNPPPHSPQSFFRARVLVRFSPPADAFVRGHDDMVKFMLSHGELPLIRFLQEGVDFIFSGCLYGGYATCRHACPPTLFVPLLLARLQAGRPYSTPFAANDVGTNLLPSPPPAPPAAPS